MINIENASIIPGNLIGKPVDLKYEIQVASPDIAINIYNRTYMRLLTPSVWSKFGGILAASFSVYASPGQTAGAHIRKGDYIKIDIPGPGPLIGKGYDWVTVEVIETDCLAGVDNSLCIRLRATKNPEASVASTAHFFKDSATSTFILAQKELNISLFYFGRNETPNVEDAQGIDKIRNAVVSLAALSGISEMQWSALLKGLLEQEN